ncbi:hypothetical protein CVT25_011427 [Psilocybe cyanescens]|uniref:C2 domain-containing protein n=1 Tax=Psilocybe cyanescens TaxID=93625 RepID=A0A409XUW9_PSICY|nr:hypothetical protein CVT25_011427 [Psilocybe cyanescens]
MALIGRESGSPSLVTLGPAQGNDGLQVNVTVLRANDLPLLKNKWGKERRFYATITDGARTKKSKSVHSRGQSVAWNEKLDGFFVQSADIKLSLYAEHHLHMIQEDTFVGSLVIGTESVTEASFPIASETAPNLTVVITVDIRQLVQATKDAIGDADEALSGMRILEEWKGVVGNIQWVMDTVGDLAQINPYAQMAWAALSSIPKSLLAQFERDQNVLALVEAMRNTFDLTQAEDLLKAIKPNSNQALILKVMLRHMKICSEVIKRYADDKEFMKRLMKSIIGGTAGEIQDLCETLGKLRQDLLDNAVISTQMVVERIQKSIEMLPKQISDMGTSSNLAISSSNHLPADLDAKMNDMSYKSGWRSVSTVDKNGCLPGTRTDFLEYITNWVDDPSSTTGFALFGQAGTGKSTIAHEIALRFQLEDRLASYFSFSRNEKSKREDHHLFTTIIHDLANRYSSFKTALGELIKDNKALRMTDDPNLLFNTLLLGPLREVDVDIPILIVIDALDESANAIGGKGLAAFLARSLGRLPSNFRVLITSRLDGDIKDWFSNADKNPFEVVEMNDSKLAKTEDDIRFYFQDPQNLSPDLFQEYGDALIQKSEGLFQWAAVACGHIKDPPSGWTESDCLRGLLNRTADDKEYAQQLNRPLYELYDSVLSGYFNTQIARRRFRSVMGHLLAAVQPFSVNSLTALRQFTPSPDQHGEGAVVAIVKNLGSLLSNVTSENRNLPIVPLHTSFRDFLTEDIEKGDSFLVDIEKSHNELAHACLGLMLQELKFNICGLESSYLPNRKIPDLDARIEKYIQPALFYACLFWDDHLEHLSFDEVIFGQLRKFFEDKFLFWLEVLSITDTVSLAMQACLMFKNWMHSWVNNKAIEGKGINFAGLVTDAYHFLRYFATPIAESAAHIYISALPFTPISSKVYQVFSHAFSNTVAFKCGQQVHWPALEMSIETPSRIHSVAFSPDGQYIATATEDGAICFWSAATGRMESEPLNGHSETVRSVAFSPDGKRIASGSNDKTICVWNVLTSEMERGPLTGHTDKVTSVAFSPDGKWIVSGSKDKTIILWDSFTGRIKRGPYTGHTKGVTSVAFSPDGKMVVSGSQDKQVRVWNISTGEQERGPFTGHTDSVNSVAFSPDGRRIVSGSSDKTILVWNVLSGAIERGPIIGHTGRVLSVSFSPDGTRIASGSYDKTLRLWYVNTGEQEQTFDGHIFPVNSVAFSPDGRRIASGSNDQTLGLWNTSARELALSDDTLGNWTALSGHKNSTFTGHTDAVRSVAFSPDGSWIVSGSADFTICLWNASTGQLGIGPITGHHGAVNSVVFSPDGKWIASGSSDRTICLWNACTGDLEQGPHIHNTDSAPTPRLPFSGHIGSILSVAFSPDGQRIASGSSDKKICVWNTLTGELEVGPFTGHTDAVVSVAFSPDGQWIGSGSFDKTVCLWNASTGQLERGPLAGHTDAVILIAFSPDGLWIVSGSMDYTLRLWNVSTGLLERGPFSGHSHMVTTVAFSPDGKRVVSGSFDTKFRVWNVSSGELEYTLPSGHLGFINSVSFSPDSTQIVSGGWDRTIRVMPARPITVTPLDEVSFNDLSAIDLDGWIRGDHGELLLWIPSLHRPGLYRPNFPTHIIGGNQTRLDTSKFVHGYEWATCYTSL